MANVIKGTVDVSELAARLAPLVEAATGTPIAPGDLRLTKMPTGMSSVTFRLDTPTTRMAVKLAPPGLEPVRNRDVLRQARVLLALGDAAEVVVPGVLFQDAGDPPDVPPMFAMTFEDGECFEPQSDAGDVPPPDVVTARARSAAHMMAALHAVPADHPAVEGEPEIALRDEVARWINLFATVNDELRPYPADACGERLMAALPDAGPPALIHGDYRLGNIIYDGIEPRAIIDWEIWAVEDPRIDLAWFMLNSDPDKPSAVRRDVGMPPLDELLGLYEDRRGSPVADLDWFHALVRFKQAAVSASIVKNNRKRGTADARIERMTDYIAPLLDRAMVHLAR
ncbi:MAG: phosphotransferase family protein [Ilumatobacteraceae bacterium]